MGSKKSSGGVMGKEVSVQRELEEEARGIGKVTSLKLGFQRLCSFLVVTRSRVRICVLRRTRGKGR